MKLKTLDDLGVNCADEDYDWDKDEVPKQFAEINKEELRQEAIKWIKYIREVHKDLDIEKCKEPEYFIKHFFNISDKEVREHNDK